QKEQGETRGPAVVDAPAAEAATEPVAPVDGNVVDANLGSPPPTTPLSPEPVESVSPSSGEPSPEPQTPPADEGQ
ncbi:MAG: hypothetical protein ABSG53_16745, partial [Thermoguttaceae bacterium]